MVCERFPLMLQLHNDTYAIKISPLGAELKSFTCKGVEYLHHGDKTYWHRSSPTLFPIVGRLKNNNYKYKSKKYTLPIHGFTRFCEFELVNQTQNSLTFLLRENSDTLKHYPFKFNLEIKYTLNKEYLRIDYDIFSDEDILFSLGAHPAFLLHANIDDTYMEFEQEESADALCLDLTLGCISHSKKEMLNSKQLGLHKEIFSKDALIFKNLNSKSVMFKNSQNKRAVKVDFDGFEYLAFWAPVGAPFVCIEPWCGVADDIDTNHRFENKNSIINLPKQTHFHKNLQISLN